MLFPPCRGETGDILGSMEGLGSSHILVALEILVCSQKVDANPINRGLGWLG